MSLIFREDDLSYRENPHTKHALQMAWFLSSIHRKSRTRHIYKHKTPPTSPYHHLATTSLTTRNSDSTSYSKSLTSGGARIWIYMIYWDLNSRHASQKRDIDQFTTTITSYINLKNYFFNRFHRVHLTPLTLRWLRHWLDY